MKFKASKEAQEKSKEFMDRLCGEILSVQPMPPNLFSDLLAAAKDEKTLIEEGYIPVSCHRILWWDGVIK